MLCTMHLKYAMWYSLIFLQLSTNLLAVWQFDLILVVATRSTMIVVITVLCIIIIVMTVLQIRFNFSG